MSVVLAGPILEIPLCEKSFTNQITAYNLAQKVYS